MEAMSDKSRTDDTDVETCATVAAGINDATQHV